MATTESALPLHVSCAAGVTTLRLERPERRNAVDEALAEALLREVRAAKGRGDAALVLTGGPSYFSSGGDVGSMPGPEGGLFGAAARLERLHEVILELAGADLVTIAAVEGYAVGVAWGLVLGCDLVVAADDAFFVAPFAARGLTADGGVAFHLPRALGRQRAAAHLYLGERLPARSAYDAGLVTELVAPGTATDRAEELAARLAAGPRESNALTKSLVARAATDELAAFLRAERVAVSLAGHGRNAQEGKSAFRERREPDFS
jgi:2-(1,2-epoxy-1,2-dihydrophenyl)acetyl-CoA isomerase